MTINELIHELDAFGGDCEVIIHSENFEYCFNEEFEVAGGELNIVYIRAVKNRALTEKKEP